MNMRNHMARLLAVAVLLSLTGSTGIFADNYLVGYNQNDGTLTLDNVNLTLPAQSDSSSETASAVGMKTNYSSSVIQTTGPVYMNITAVNTQGGATEADAVKAYDGKVDINADGKNTVQIIGDIEAYSGSKVSINLSDASSYLQAAYLAKYGVDSPDQAVLTLSNGATFRLDYDKQNLVGGSAQVYGTVNLNDGGIFDLTWDNPTRTTRREVDFTNLNATNGTVKINADLQNMRGDSIVINGSTSGCTLNLNVVYDPIFATGKSYMMPMSYGLAGVFADTSVPLTVTPVISEYNELRYQPVLNNVNSSWFLIGYTLLPSIGSTGVTENVKMIADSRDALHKLWLGETNNLAKRMGDLRGRQPAASGIWARYGHTKLDTGDNERQDDVSANYFQIGYDKDTATDNGRVYRGLAVSYAKGTADYERGDGDLKETTLSLYQTWIGKSGHYYDIILKGGKFINDYNVTTKNGAYSEGDYNTWAYSISGEYGRRKDIAHGLYVEPQAELILGHMNGTDYTTSTGMKSKVDSNNMAITRLGVALGKETARGNIYARASYFHDFGGGIHATAGDTVTYDRDVAHNWSELAVGGSVNAGQNCQIYGELSKYLGGLSSNVQVDIGARWKF